MAAGAHFGHLRSRRHPGMRPYIFAVKNRLSIINLELTQTQIAAASEFLETVAARGEQVLLVGTKRQAKRAVTAAGDRLHLPSVAERWLGGTLTNSKVILERLDRLRLLETHSAAGTKKEELLASRALAKLRRRLGGLTELKVEMDPKTREPNLRIGALILIDVRRERTALLEAKRAQIPVVALIDVDADPALVDYPIVMNDDATAAIELVVETLGQAIEAGLKEASSHSQKLEASNDKGAEPTPTSTVEPSLAPVS